MYEGFFPQAQVFGTGGDNSIFCACSYLGSSTGSFGWCRWVQLAPLHLDPVNALFKFTFFERFFVYFLYKV